MRQNVTSRTLLVLSLGLGSALAGCGSGTTFVSTPISPVPPYNPPQGNYAGPPFTGKVLAGLTPVVGASVQIYAAGATGNGSAPTQLLSTSLTTDSNGAFAVATSYTCPYNTSVLYVVASGGQVGSAANPGSVLMTSPGACSTISSNQVFVVDEVSTVASAYAFAQFLKPGAQIGATATNSSGITLAAGTLANLVNLTTGVAPGAAFPATGTSPAARLNALANIVNACITSSSTCTSFYAATTVSGVVPVNTLDALLNIAQHPGASTAAIYGVASTSAYSPTLTSAPSDWTMFVNYTGAGMNGPSSVSIDSGGRVWVSNYFYSASLFSNTGAPSFATGITGNGLYNSYGGAVDANDNFWAANEQSGGGFNNGLGSITVLTNAGQPVGGTPYGAGGLNFPISVYMDASNVSWIVDYGNSHLTLLNTSGVPQSGTSGYDGIAPGSSVAHFFFPVAVAVDSNRNGWVANFASNTVTKVSADGNTYTDYACGNGAAGVAVDQSNNVWVANFYGSTVALISSGGKIVSGAGYVGGGIDQPQSIAVDGAGNAWALSYRSPIGRNPVLTELSGATSASPGAVLSPTGGLGNDAQMVEAFDVAIDAAGNVWASSFGSNVLTQFIGLAAPVKTPLLGPVRTP